MKPPVTPIVAPALPHSHFHTAVFNYAFFICFLQNQSTTLQWPQDDLMYLRAPATLRFKRISGKLLQILYLVIASSQHFHAWHLNLHT